MKDEVNNSMPAFSLSIYLMPMSSHVEIRARAFHPRCGIYSL
jgi:hypothetical protein